MLLSKRGAEELRTYEEINQKIKSGDAIVMTADDFIKTIEDSGLERAAKEVDVVTTGTFGAMCSSGAFINFGHSEPPIKMFKCWLNDVPAYKGLAAVDCYLGATAMSETKGFDYGGGHVIEDLVSGKEIELRAEAYGTDCYPRRSIETTVTIDDLNQAVLLNPRNAYERYNAATNSTDRIIHTYMGTLLPHYGNVTYSGSGQLSPLYKDKGFETIGIGTRIFLGGGIGYVIGEGTQHSPQNQFGTIMVRGDLKQMTNRYLRGATYYKYGTTLYVGIGIPIPIINERVAASAALKDEDIFTEILDYGVPSRSRPSVKRTSYSELRSGRVEINGRETTSSSLSSNKVAKEIATNLKGWIEEGAFFLNRPAELVPDHEEFKPLELRRKEPRVRDIMTRELVVGKPTDDIKSVARILIAKGVDHLPIADGEGKLMGIITSWDLAKAVAQDKRQLHEIMTMKVVTAKEDETIDTVVRRMEQHNISGVPVVDHSNRILGMLTVNDISKKLIRRP
ncbi:MAG: homocysteine biosynthesis protein [Nitrososphaerales archaeon]